MINPVHMEQERQLRIQDICQEILGNARNELYLHMRFLDVALSSLPFVPDMGIQGLGTDGANLYYHPELLMRWYRDSRVLVNRAYLHSLFHCLFAHMLQEREYDEAYWNLACDITTEYVLDGLYISCLHIPKRQTRRECYQQLRREMPVVTAQKMYRWLCKKRLSDTAFLQLAQEFHVDDHVFWKQEKPPEQKQQLRQKWDDIRDKMQTEMETFAKDASENSQSLKNQLQVENQKRYDYREFLRKFSVLKEEVQVDMDSFDYVFYHYGMELYGNMPLIEPQETKEVEKIEDFVIAIDTSMSCKGELVQHFLEETYSVLLEKESFFKKIRVHIIQCDEQIQQDVVITSREEMKEYMDHFTIVGQGGTDFRPVFAYVQELLARGEFTRLRGLLYFTDGYGIFPAKMPNYDTAFVFMKEDYRDMDVPPWAYKLIIDKQELEEEIHYEY